METRILPPEEWPRLKGTEAERLWPYLVPDNTRVLVVEDEGEIVGVWVMLRIVHAECLWAAPKYRGSFGVAKRLFKGLREVAAEWSVDKVVTGSVSPHVTDLIKRFGGKPMPCESFILPVEMKTRQAKADRESGRKIHEQLDALVKAGLLVGSPEHNEALGPAFKDGEHSDADEHNEAVGRMIRVGVDEQQPERAIDEYNHWAFRAGFIPMKYLGTHNGWMRADVFTGKVEIDANHTVRVADEELVCR